MTISPIMGQYYNQSFGGNVAGGGRQVAQQVAQQVANAPAPKKSVGIIGTAVLLIGGAALGYGHRNQIGKGLETLKGAVTKLLEKPAMAQIVEKGKALLAKVKDVIFVKAK